MNLNKNLQHQILLLLLVIYSSWMSGCKKEPAGNTTDIALNFYSASDVAWAGYAPLRLTTAIYVDTLITQHGLIDYNSNLSFPHFVYGYNSHEYPQLINQGQVQYARFLAGVHRLRFTDAANNVMVDTTIPAAQDSYHTLYLLDAPANTDLMATFRILSVEEERSSAPVDKTGIRFIHLSPDAGDLTVDVTGEMGSTVAQLPVTLQYGAATSYQYVDAADVSDGVLRLKLFNKITGSTILTGIPFHPGQRYAVVVTGFQQSQQRKLAVNLQPDGSSTYQQVEVPANLRAEIRRMY